MIDKLLTIVFSIFTRLFVGKSRKSVYKITLLSTETKYKSDDIDDPITGYS